jgi:hypothetical protein
MSVSQESSQFQFQAQALAIAEMWLTLAAVDEVRTEVSDIEERTTPLTEFNLTCWDAGDSNLNLGVAMQDRDSFYHHAIRTKLGEATRVQRENVVADGKEPKGLDLDNPEQRRRSMEGEP